jgi:hypothetical protein
MLRRHKDLSLTHCLFGATVLREPLLGGMCVPSRSMDRPVAILAAGQEDFEAISVRHRRR